MNFIFGFSFFLVAMKLFSMSQKSRKDYKHWHGILDQNISTDAHATFVMQFVLGLIFLASAVAIIAISLGS